MLYVTSDLHLFHKNIIKPDYDDLPFEDVYEMNEEIIDSWLRTVSDKDTVFFLGDLALTNNKVSMDKIQNLVKIWKKLPGNKIFIRGNHDGQRLIDALIDEGVAVHQSFSIYLDYFNSMDDLIFLDMQMATFQLKYPKARLNFIHNPLPFVHGMKENDFLIYGHTHRLQLQHDRAFNACWCNVGIIPITNILKQFIANGDENKNQ